MTEDEVKNRIHQWLTNKGWCVSMSMGHAPGIDIDARRDTERWIIEAKGIGSRSQMRRNYFYSVLGNTLNRMADQTAKYSIAFPDIMQYRNMWSRFPQLAKERTEITILFVAENGITHLEE